LQALLSNSIEAGAHRITLKGEPVVSGAKEQGVRLHIIDDGPGLSTGGAESLFKPFFTTKSFGTGLGLYLAKKVIESHGGSLSLQSHIPHGVEGIIWLPCRAN
jgi:signal transduction histidine kinase